MLSTPVGPPPTTHAQGAVVDRGRIAVRGLPLPQHMFLEVHGVVERVHGKGVFAGSLDAEVVDLCPEADDQIVVIDRIHLLELDPAALEVDRGHGRLMDAGIGLVMEEIAQRVGDLARLDHVGRELIEHRLERVKVVVVDQDDVRVSTLELARGAEAAESSAENQNHRALAVGVGHQRLVPPPSRSSRWSPTRRAFAIAVSAGLTAPMLGKKLVSTT